MGVTYKTRCAKCGYNKEFKLGVGFFGLEVPERAERDILSGRLGGEIKKFYSACKSPRVLAGRAVYRCPYCGDLQNIPEIIVQDEDGAEYLHEYLCTKCRKAKLVKIGAGDEFPDLPCPKCGEKLKVVDTEAWD